MTLRARQLAFAAHLRAPSLHPAPPALDDRRLRVYRDLFFKNVFAFMRTGFPVIRRTLGDDALAALVRAWYAEHRARTPVFPRLPGEFVAWLTTRPAAADDAPPWLRELAHYEWVELELQLDPAEVDQADADPAGDPLHGVPVLSPVARILAYDWPVHRIGPDWRPAQPDRTLLLVYRGRDDEVRFMALNAATHALLERVRHNRASDGATLLAGLHAALPDVDPAVVTAAGRATLAELLTRGALSGVRKCK